MKPNTRYVNDMLIRLINLKNTMAKLDSNQVNLSDLRLDHARQYLVDEYNKTYDLLIRELDQTSVDQNPTG
jgi:hypothetical protein